VLFLTACNSSTNEKVEGYKNLCLMIEEAVNQEKVEVIDELFDGKALAQNIIDKYPQAPDYYKTGFKEGFDNFYTPGTILASSAGHNSQYKFLRLKSTNPPIGLFRISSPDMLNYQEVFLGETENGSPIIKDFYAYQEAEWFSQGLERMYIINLSQEMKDFIHTIADALPIIAEAAEEAEHGHLAPSFVSLKKLPENVLKQKVVLLMLMNMGAELNEDSLTIASDIFKKHYPKDPLLELKLFDYSMLQSDTSKIILALDNLNKKIGGDVYIDVMKAAIFKNNNQISKAEGLLKNALEKEPDNEESYWLYFDLLAKQKNYSEIIRIFEQFRKEFDDDPSEYLDEEKYADFLGSEEFLDWKGK